MKKNSRKNVGAPIPFLSKNLSSVSHMSWRTNNASRKHLLQQSRKIKNLEHLLESHLPEENESVHIITERNFDAFSFVLLILQSEKIIELWAAVYRIGEKTSKALLQLIKDGEIGNVSLVINDGFKAFAPEVDRLLLLNSEKLRTIKCNNHAKVTLMKTESGKYFVVEGSGNWSINARIEQYVFLQSEDIFNFHKAWMEGRIRP